MMNDAELARITDFINRNIDSFHENRLRLIQSLKLHDILKRKNPYLFRAKNLTSPDELVASFLDALLSSSEEGLFGKFLEELALFVSQITVNGQKSSSPGIDLEFTRENIRYIVAVKSGPNWGNSSQHRALERNFQQASIVLRQSRQVLHVQPILGICYGRAKDADKGIYQKLCGQSFWTFISGDTDLYLKIIEPLGHTADARNAAFLDEKRVVLARFVQEFAAEFSDETGQIDWQKLVRFNSQNVPYET